MINQLKDNKAQNGVVEEEDDISAEISRLLRSAHLYRLDTLMVALRSYLGVHFTGCAKCQFGYEFKCAANAGIFRIQGGGNKNGCYELIVADVKNKTLLGVWIANPIFFNLLVIKLSESIREGIIDLDNTGRYWEGGVLKGDFCFPCGYGKEYNAENNLVYEGFVFEGRRVCYGKEYRGIRGCKRDNNGLVYEVDIGMEFAMGLVNHII